MAEPRTKKQKFSHLYGKIVRSTPPPGTPPVEKQKYLSDPHTVEVIGVSFSAGQPKLGVEAGPDLLIREGILDQLERLGWIVNCPDALPSYEHHEPEKDGEDYGILKNVEYVSRVTKDVHHTLKAAAKKGHLALTLGGDHSIGIATVSGACAVWPDIGVIWVDAHADINTAETTDSGNLHGCPVSFLMGIGPKVKAFDWLKPCLKKDRIVYIGLRDVDSGEKKLLKEHGIKAFSMHDVDKYGIAGIMKQTFDYLGHNTPIHLSFDVDAMDPSIAPATGTPVRGGLTFREGHYICEEIFETGRLVSMDMVEVNPALALDEQAKKTTIAVGCSLIRASMGETLL
ncbi:arginase [Globomyces pollinis-pini]|nr:arginase [Globomyces pollinis-pini]KAJ2993687.1 Arginase, catabolizes arginine to ornithine and urea [Globomyces sp. JEL0801]